ncbi:MAG: T9SS type A sorting domain-containing protein [Bacteroidota bacterium]|nr:T9SS type A sorting domain-containing protein [Bacteroidota bacterium]
MLDFIPNQNRDAAEIFNGMLKQPNISQLMNFGYDFYIVDWKNSRVDMRSNALLIVELLDALKAEVENDYEFVIIGESMGGVIARYALCYMESPSYMNPTLRPSANRRERMHNCRLMITWDSPHQGANFPLSAQYLYKTLSGSGSFFGMPNLTKQIARNFNLFLDADATRQLLIYHIDTKSGSGMYKTYSKHSKRSDFLGDLNSLGDYPKYCKKMAISNGALNGEMQTKFYDETDRTPNDHFLNFEGEFFAKILGIQVPLFGANLELKSNPDGQGEIFQMNAGTFGIRIKFYWFGFNIITGYNSLINITEYADVKPYCVSPGGYFWEGLEQVVGKSYDNNTDWELSKSWLFNLASFRSGSDGSGCWGSKAHIGLNGFLSANYNLSLCSDGMHFGFIPLQSALDLNASGLGLGSLHDNIEGSYSAGQIMANTPFDVIVGNSGSDDIFMGTHNINRSHLYVKYEDQGLGQNELESEFFYQDCDPIQKIYGHWINREIGDEILYLDNLDCNRSSIYEAVYKLNVNTFNNPWYTYTAGSSGRPGFYSKSNDFVIRDNVNADFRYDLSTHNPPTVINYEFNPSASQGTSPYDGTWTDNIISAPLACNPCIDFGKRKITRDIKDNQGKLNSFANIFPNPNSTGQLFISCSFLYNFPVEISVRNVLGEIVHNKIIPATNSGQKQINTAIQLNDAYLSKGLYFVVITSGEERFAHKLIIN